MHPNQPYISIRMTEPEARDLLELLDGVDREGGKAFGRQKAITRYDNIAYRIRKAEVRFPRGRQRRRP